MEEKETTVLSVLDFYSRQPRQWRRRIFLICSSASEAGRIQVEEATTNLLQLGGVPQAPGSSIWSLNGHLVQFLSAQGQIATWMRQLKGAVVLVLCDDSDFGDNWYYTLSLFRSLHQNNLAWIMIPSNSKMTSTESDN